MAAFVLGAGASFAGLCSLPRVAQADDSSGSSSPSQDDRTNQPEEDDFSTTPYTTYGEFNEDKKEEESTQFFQYGRFFGLSLGLGAEFIDGNRGALYQGGVPLFDFRLVYWFDFNFALDLGFYYVQNSYYIQSGGTNPPSSGLAGAHEVNFFQAGVDVKYYFDTKNMSAPISFANPYLMVGVGSYSENDTAVNDATTNTDTEIGFNFGGGLEFTLSPKSTYLELEANMRLVTFQDTYNTEYAGSANNIPNLTGNFYTVVAKVLFTW